MHLIILTYQYQGLRIRASPAAVENHPFTKGVHESVEKEASNKLHELLALKRVPFTLHTRGEGIVIATVGDEATG